MVVTVNLCPTHKCNRRLQPWDFPYMFLLKKYQGYQMYYCPIKSVKDLNQFDFEFVEKTVMNYLLVHLLPIA